MRRRWGGGRLHKGLGKEKDKSAMIFKVHREEADWPEEGRQKDDWIRPVMSAMSLTGWESDVKCILCSHQKPGK